MSKECPYCWGSHGCDLPVGHDGLHECMIKLYDDYDGESYHVEFCCNPREDQEVFCYNCFSDGRKCDVCNKQLVLGDTMKVKPATLEHEGKEYEIQLGTIGFTRLGREDHGIMTYVLDFSFGGSGQNTGAMNLNGRNYLGEHIIAVLDFFKCNWEDLPGKRAFVLREEYNGYIRGLMNETQTEVIIFSEINAKAAAVEPDAEW